MGLQCDEVRRILLNELRDRDSSRVGSLYILETILIRASLQPDAISLLAIKAGERIRLHGLQRKAYVRCGVDVGDRGRDVTVRGSTGILETPLKERGVSQTKNRPVMEAALACRLI